MKIIIQRVEKCLVKIENKIHSEIGKGLLVLVGIKDRDDFNKIDWIINKIINLRIFNDSNGKMNLSVKDIDGEIMIVSNFTLYADASKGFRPSFINAAIPEIAIPIYDKLIENLKTVLPNKVQTGVFGADMKINLINDGPVTIEISKD